MGLGVRVFEFVLESGSAEAWNGQSVPRRDVQKRGRVWLGRRSLDAAGVLGLLLHHLNSAMAGYTLQQVFGITPAVFSRSLNWGLKLLLQILLQTHDARIAWPSPHQCSKYAQAIQKRHPLLDSAIGFVDGCHLPVASSSDVDVQNAYYNGWCADHFTFNLFVFAPDGTIIFCTLNSPGSWHDAAIARDLFNHLMSKASDGYYLIRDTAFPTARELSGLIRTPPKRNFMHYPDDAAACRRFIAFNKQLVSARQAAEWGMSCLQGSFGRLKLPLPAEDNHYRFMVLKICAHLHNIRTRLEGIHQIATVYKKEWKSGGEYTEFKEMLFGDIKKNDRIRRYYTFIP
jgi:hypothetical protein